MNLQKNITRSLATLALLTLSVSAVETAPKYKADVPQGILTPDVVETKLLGTLHFKDGMPSEATVKKVYDYTTPEKSNNYF